MNRGVNLRALPSGSCELDFSWYEAIRVRLIPMEVASGVELLDVGCGRGDILLMLSTQVKRGVGIDLDEAALQDAECRRKKQGITNLVFAQDNVLDLSFPDASFDVVLLLGDVLAYHWLYGKHDLALAEIWRVLRRGGKVIHESMNWEWEYRSYAPTVSSFKQDGETTWRQSGDGKLTFHRTKRTAAGVEITQDYQVVPGSLLEKWVRAQAWPSSPQGYNTSLDVEETGSLPKAWLKSTGVSRYRHYRPHDLKRLYRRAGFKRCDVFAYGQTYDIAEKAGLLQGLARFQDRLAEAEAQLAYTLRLGSGPWLLLVAKKG